MPSHFTDLPNEIILIIWMYLTHAETIKSFSLIKCQRYIQLLESYCYKSIDFYTTTFSTFQLCCTQMLDQYRLNVQILKLGHRDCYSQIRLFSHYCLNSSSLLDVFPQLQTLVLRNIHDLDTNDLIPYLSIIPFLEKFTLYKCTLSKISLLICEHLFNNSIENRLNNCILYSNNQNDGLLLSEHLPSSYQSNHSLTYLQIDVRNFVTLKYLLIFLPNLLILDIHLGTHIKQSYEDLFSISFHPCCNLTKLIMRLQSMVVLNIFTIIKFILLFQNSLQTLHLVLLHQDPNFKHSLNYIDGDLLFNNIVIHMKIMKDFSFWIETTCLCNQQMNNIIQSFQTEYWLTIHIGCYYDSVNCVYVMFTLPYFFNIRFMITNDTLHTHFNHTNDRLDDLIPMLYIKAPGVIILTNEHECLSKSFSNMLKQGIHKKKSIEIESNGVYQLEHSDNNISQFDILKIIRRNENQTGVEYIHTTMTWLTWMPHIRILNIDNEILFQLSSNNFNLDQFLSIQIFIVRQTNNSLTHEPLTILNRLGRSSSLNTIHLEQYRMNSQFTINDLFLILSQICHNLYVLKIMTIEFHKDAFFNVEMIENLTDVQKKNCHLEYFHASGLYIELWFTI